ncbi:lymphocyte antigen 6D isoform X1 [Vespula maculifrons]|uniref:Lymphocyte antigen 6D isoform X1 n=1 Tax=Vespula maculifrons TaxID=7453 RepID=A0ABD2CHA7_VESMC
MMSWDIEVATSIHTYTCASTCTLPSRRRVKSRSRLVTKQALGHLASCRNYLENVFNRSAKGIPCHGKIFLLDDVATFSNEILVASLLLRFHRGESMGFEILWSFHPRIPGHDPDRCRPYNPRPRSSLLRRVHLTKRHLRTEFIRTERYAFDRLGKLNSKRQVDFPTGFFRPLESVAQGIRCYKCGQYNEGVGSITPCINFTVQMGLKDCPPTSEWCIFGKKNEKEGERKTIRYGFSSSSHINNIILIILLATRIRMGLFKKENLNDKMYNK